MKKILSGLFWGDIAPHEADPALSPDCKEAQNEMALLEQQILALLPEEQQQALWDDYLDARTWKTVCEDEQFFIHGFCLGARMMLEVLQYMPDPKR